ncbi:MAG: hypothetical protein GY720_10795 [bacterium]|nr:hypothetical protein [bacterium]
MKRLLLAAVVVGLAAAACGMLNADTTHPVTGPTTAAPSSSILDVPDGETAQVTNVFDGDSFEAEVDGRDVEVRMLGINAPEGYECHGNVARARLRELIDSEDVTLVADGEDADDRFGRLLRSVYTESEFVNATMVAEGHALVLQSGDPQERSLIELADRAFDNRLGMWSPDACDDPAEYAVTVADIEYDPAGRDWENKADEWVTIRNNGEEPIELSDWILRDESSSHRYEFPAGEVLDAGGELRIRTGCGNDGGDDRFWCADDAVWSNGGDTVILQTASGTVVARVRYDGDY